MQPLHHISGNHPTQENAPLRPPKNPIHSRATPTILYMRERIAQNRPFAGPQFTQELNPVLICSPLHAAKPLLVQTAGGFRNEGL